VLERFLGKNRRMDPAHDHFCIALPIFVRDRVCPVRRIRRDCYSDKVCLLIEIYSVEGLLYDSDIPIRRRLACQQLQHQGGNAKLGS
jgi:hypothetical protein